MRVLAFWLCALPVPLAVPSCGARTGIDVPPVDAGASDRVAPADHVVPDDRVATDDRVDAPRDASHADVLPIIDASPRADAAVCPDGGPTVAYLVSQSAQLYTFDPATLSTGLVGQLACPASGAGPWTLTVSSTGRGYLMYTDWNVYEVDLSTLACVRSAYAPGQLGLVSDVGITIAPDAGHESLYYVGPPSGASSLLLAVSDLSTFTLAEVGPVVPTPSELALDIRADAFGRIFGLGNQGTLVQIDRATGAVVAEDATSFRASNWALLTYQTELYFFSGSDVSRYDLGTKQLTPLGTIGILVVGASAAPCVH
jgi:hypothetical protein